MSLNSFADVQNLFKEFVTQNSVPIDDSPHGNFWAQDPDPAKAYDAFVNGDVPNVQDGIGQPVKVLISGSSKDSNIIKVLQGSLPGFSRMPSSGPPFMSDLHIKDLADWIDRNCPK